MSGVADQETDLQYVVSELGRRKGSWPAISAATKVPYFTISKIASGTTDDPRFSTVDKLARYFRDTSSSHSQAARA